MSDLPTAHLSGSSVTPYGPYLTLIRPMAATDRFFWTTVVDGIQVGDEFVLVIDPGHANAERVYATCVVRDHNELMWEIDRD